MRFIIKLAATVVAGTLLAGCGGEDFTGSYRAKNPSNSKVELVLNIHGNEAELIGQELGTGRIKPLVKMTVSVKDGKLLLDDVNSSERLAMKRNVDEQSLDCLNCKILRIKDDTVWKYDPKGPYDVDQMLKDQAGRDEEQLNAELAKIQEKALQQGMRDLEAPKLTPYEGDWVYQRTTKQDPLTIMTIWRKSQIKSWSFKFETMDRLGHEVPGFEVSEAGLKIGTGPKAHLYSLSPDKKTLTCMDCTKPERWLKADPNKDLSDRYYARQMAGNP
ncbi:MULTISPECIES: hypothetical protein [Pseudomonadaceae]|uniref:Lipoprotein n=3 Tax=Gammaproteobacteria TaxID=1236 RepID=A0ABU7HJG9_9PSED|nr:MULTISPECIES: hypothetical protein [Pseudomonadaceae]AWF68496.1 hypothetical protein CSC27_6363 [Pseudomonas aeruginosa]EIU4876450.1 hypothetical protein [Pseudomonas aeruginosa]EKU7943675.1 hypothetical protein [Pseudomonas aeruginosa]KQJ63231.1 hypothetical protein AN399_17510 [Pseudomonas aeruginosa]KSD51569.1 hypothetical protein AO905_24020 [Pseudomonas aeruginosa]